MLVQRGVPPLIQDKGRTGRTREICSLITQCYLGMIDLVSFNMSETIKTTPDELYKYLSNFESAPKRSNFWKSVKPVTREGNSSIYETVEEVEGRTLRSMTRVTTQPAHGIESQIIEGDGKGSRFSYTILPSSEGTRLTIEGEIILAGFAQMLSGTAGKMLGGIVEGRFESIIRKELEIAKKTLEH